MDCRFVCSRTTWRRQGSSRSSADRGSGAFTRACPVYRFAPALCHAGKGHLGPLGSAETSCYQRSLSVRAKSNDLGRDLHPLRRVAGAAFLAARAVGAVVFRDERCLHSSVRGTDVEGAIRAFLPRVHEARAALHSTTSSVEFRRQALGARLRARATATPRSGTAPSSRPASSGRSTPSPPDVPTRSAA